MKARGNFYFWLSFYLLLLLLSHCNKAKALDLLVGQRTHHFHSCWNWEQEGRPCEGVNESQELIGLSTDRWALVYMHQNSLREEAFILTRKWDRDWGQYLRPYVAIGVATGYEELGLPGVAGLTPVGYLGLDLHPRADKLGLVVTWVPEGFVGLGLRVKLE